MKNIFFTRHAESIANANGITMAHNAIPLSQLGKKQALFLSELWEVPPPHIIVSEMQRTHETAAPLCQRFNLKPQTLACLNEFSVIDPVLIEGLTGEQRKPFVEEYWKIADPFKRLGNEADRLVDLIQRIKKFIQIMPELPHNTVVFGHGTWFSLFNWYLLGYHAENSSQMQKFRRFQLSFPTPNCGTFQLKSSDLQHWSVQANSEWMDKIEMIN